MTGHGGQNDTKKKGGSTDAKEEHGPGPAQGTLTGTLGALGLTGGMFHGNDPFCLSHAREGAEKAIDPFRPKALRQGVLWQKSRLLLDSILL
jgi:hypothetical protein